MQFKTPRIQAEFGKLAEQNIMLKRLLVALDNFCVAELGREIDLTSIFRTPEENKAENAASEVHCVWHAADVSIHGFSVLDLHRMLEFCELFTYRGTKGKPVMLVHQVPGGAAHAHLQYF